MNNVAGSLTYDTKLDTNGFEKNLNNLSSKAVAFGNLMADAFKKVANAMGDVIKQGVSYNAQIEQYETALTTLTGNAEKANNIIEKIKEDAAKTPFDVAGLTQANQLLISAGINSDKAREDILALGNAISATGGGSEELSRMAVNLQQIKNVGKASALDIKQFAYAGIDVYGLLADSMGITREEATNLDVTYEQLTDALKYASKEGGKYYQAMEKQSKTLNGQISTLKDNFMSFKGKAAEPLFNLLKDKALPTLNGILTGTLDFREAVPKLAEDLTGFIGEALTKLMDMLPQVVDVGIKIITSLIKGIAKQLPTLIPKIKDCILAIVNTIINNLDQIIDAGIEILLALIEGITEALPDLIAKIPEIITKLVLELTKPETLARIIEAGIKIIIALAEGLIKAIPELIKAIPKIIKGLWDGLWERINSIDWAELGLEILKGIAKGLLRFAEVLATPFKKLGNWLRDKFDGFKNWLGFGTKNEVVVRGGGRSLNDDTVEKVNNAVSNSAFTSGFSSLNKSASDIISGNIVIENHNTLELDGETVYKNQNAIQKNKNLQFSFGGGSVK